MNLKEGEMEESEGCLCFFFLWAFLVCFYRSDSLEWWRTPFEKKRGQITKILLFIFLLRGRQIKEIAVLISP